MASSNSPLQPTDLASQFLWPLRAAFWAIVVGICLWLFCMSAQIFWAYRYAPDRPIAYADQVLEADLQSTALMTPQFFQPTALAWALGNEIKAFTFDFVGDSLAKLASFPTLVNQRNRAASSAVVPAYVRRPLLPEHGDKVVLALTTSYIFAARTAMFIAVGPFMVLLYLMAACDGLSARAIRRACAGRESSSLYHRGKLGQAFVVSTAYACFLGLPVAVNPLWVVLPTAVACSLLARLQVAFYKKYL